jgi:hypothetical protein
MLGELAGNGLFHSLIDPSRLRLSVKHANDKNMSSSGDYSYGLWGDLTMCGCRRYQEV